MDADLHPFLAWSLRIGLVLMAVACVLTVIRLLKGPTLPDRIVAIDLFGVLAVALIGLYAIWARQAILIDAAIALALVAFFGTVAYARFVERRGMQRGDGEDAND